MENQNPARFSGGQTSAAKRARILLVAGDRITMTLVSFILSKRGCRVNAVTNALKAVRELGEDRAAYDAVVACGDLPVMSGADLCREAKKLSRDIKVIFVADDENAPPLSAPAGPGETDGFDYFIGGGLKVQKINDALDFVLNRQ